MSCNYYKKARPTPPPNCYGFKQVNARELQEIIKRVTTPTYSAKLSTEDNGKVNNYEYLVTQNGRHCVASACSRRTVSSRISSATTAESSSDGRPRRLTERELSRIVRRLQRPTTATTLHSVGRDKSEITHDNQQQKFYSKIGNQLSETAAKSVEKLRRPTTATIAKSLNTCHLCYEHENKEKPEVLDAFDYDYSDDKIVPAEEVDYIVSRVAAPTYASTKGQHSCVRTPVYIDEVKIRSNLPLLSGLKRSKNIREINERLCPSRRHGFRTLATTITTY